MKDWLKRRGGWKSSFKSRRSSTRLRLRKKPPNWARWVRLEISCRRRRPGLKTKSREKMLLCLSSLMTTKSDQRRTLGRRMNRYCLLTTSLTHNLTSRQIK